MPIVPPEIGLAGYLLPRGFVAIPLRVNTIGHFEMAVTVEGHAAQFLLDTGASHTVVARPSAERFGLDLSPSAERAGGVGTAGSVTETAVVKRLTLGTL